MRGLQGKTVIVTGGGGGIGGATCRRFAAEGARVAVFDIAAAAAEATVAAIAAQGGTAKAFVCDIADHEAVRARGGSGARGVRPHRRARQQRRLGHLPSLPQDHAGGMAASLIAINLVGALNLHHAVLPDMAQRRSGRIVNIASDAARVGSSGEAVYAACKAGLVGLTKTLAREHAREGITLNVVCPGPTETALFGDFLNACQQSGETAGGVSPLHAARAARLARGSCPARSCFSPATTPPSSPGRSSAFPAA